MGQRCIFVSDQLYNLNQMSAAIEASQNVGAKCSESCLCCVADSGKAAMPAMMPATMKIKETRDQMTPQHCEEPPYLSANTLASEELTFLRMRSSH